MVPVVPVALLGIPSVLPIEAGSGKVKFGENPCHG
jgi:hypothetical protein